MIQASERWVYDRLGTYKTVECLTEYVSPEIGEILLRGKTGDIFSILLGYAEIQTLMKGLQTLAATMAEHPSPRRPVQP